MNPISMRAVAESNRHYFRNQEHNSDCYERLQRVDPIVIESRMTRAVNRNPWIYKTSRETSHIYIFFLDWRFLVRRTEFTSVENAVIL